MFHAPIPNGFIWRRVDRAVKLAILTGLHEVSYHLLVLIATPAGQMRLHWSMLS
jgi:hypothetical protein